MSSRAQQNQTGRMSSRVQEDPCIFPSGQQDPSSLWTNFTFVEAAGSPLFEQKNKLACGGGRLSSDKREDMGLGLLAHRRGGPLGRRGRASRTAPCTASQFFWSYFALACYLPSQHTPSQPRKGPMKTTNSTPAGSSRAGAWITSARSLLYYMSAFASISVTPVSSNIITCLFFYHKTNVFHRPLVPSFTLCLLLSAFLSPPSSQTF